MDVSTKVLMIAQNFYPEIGSAANRMKNIYELLNEKGYEVKILTTEASYPNQNLYQDKNFWISDRLNQDEKIYRVRVKKRKFSFNMINRLLFYLEFTWKMILFVLMNKEKFDIVFVSSPPIFIGLAGIIAKIRYRAKLVLDIRDLWPDSLKGVGVFNYQPILWFFTKVEVLLYKTADAIVVNSPSFQDHIEKVANISEEKILYIPNGAREFELQDDRATTDKFKAIYAGNIGLAQDVQFLKTLANELNKEKVHLSIVGYGIKCEELKTYVEEHQLDHISFISPTIRERCLALNREHDVGILALKKEQIFDTVLPGKLIDYMTSGLPLIASVSGFSKNLIEKYEVGYITEGEDVAEVVKQIRHLKENPHICQKMQSNSTRLIRENFYWEKNIEKLIHLFGTLEDPHVDADIKSQLSKVKSYE